jgi:hypothetical protein
MEKENWPSEICVKNVLWSNGAMRNGGTSRRKKDGGHRKAKICCYNLVTPKANKTVQGRRSGSFAF